MANSPAVKTTKSSSEKINKEDDPPDSFFLKNKISKTKEPLKRLGPFFVSSPTKNMAGDERKILIRPKIRKNGIELNVNGNPFSINYPKNLWRKYPFLSQKLLAENLSFALTLHLPYILDINSLSYQMPEPLIKEVISEGFKNALPATAFSKSKKTSEILNKFSKIEYHFNGEKNRTYQGAQTKVWEGGGRVGVPPQRKTENVAVMLFSFGKDSLLTYGVCNEIGIKTIPFYVKEPLSPIEDYNKEILAKRFFEEFKKKVLFVENGAGQLRDFINNDGYGWELNLAQFGLMGLPIAYVKKARYLFYSNEQSCNYKFLDQEGFWGYPAYDQTVEWILNLQRIVRVLGMKNLKVGSLIEPLHDLAIIRILHHRYPEIAKYQMSCGEDEPEMKNHRWCGNCSKCARVYIFLLANKINPKNLDFPTNMLQLKHKNKFALFEDGTEKSCGYDKARLGRDEQLLAFYLAYKNSYEGELIDLFKKLYLKEAEKREKELKKKYFGIHSTTTVPNELREKTLRIFREELKNLERI
ncbi:MAG: hypothetical protein CO031_00600 [Candidatus Nealsonbacteria bacterium CG_4_9_14_0_2_um_filter_37_38]|uniref:Uncharacterized protein n=1 Tax=Candidatus Nealsonbacteria bacterium CG_4_10_14_0_8_um_filter_37_14 TaxID=1974684 RepID=A0A2M7R690_9BACT|nr:MAG: hypothetical protein COV63_00495 [Candidatus Nealsonbacteria bacterium CG11_big_fil_rev_8_21_14_0_20_37_68]PIY89087.1 MAG: hypothetical protein COY73_01975 [Candidatus Nealsonbacteria bacterium CG_4_10_14_0_8_um_filter_37_14]PJC51835.1 MAG: hypothetical protein CO031_00600 [Candidatus Nealsonbacteria bacterium CG_4_9_14_0_2_um_filter_37_38]